MNDESKPSGIVMVGHKKGGVGKSTIAINLGAAMLRSGLSVEILDLDRGSRSATQYSEAAKALRELSPTTTTSIPDTHWYPGTDEGKSGSSPLDVETGIATVLTRLSERCDVVIIDAGAGDTIENAIAIRYSDLLVIPFACDYGAIIPTMEYVHQLTRMKSRPPIRMLLNMYMPSRQATKIVETHLQAEDWPFPALNAKIPIRTGINEALIEGRTVFDDRRVGYEAIAGFDGAAEEILELLKGEA